MSTFFFVVAIPVGIFILTTLFSVVAVYREKQVAWHLAPLRVPTSPQGASVNRSGLEVSTTSHAAAYRPTSGTSATEESLPVSPFAMRQGVALEAMGFQFLCTMRHSKGGLYKIRYDVLLSPDRLILALIEAGSMTVFNVSNVSLISLGLDRGGPERRESDPRKPRTGKPGSDAPRQKCSIESITSEACYDGDMGGRIKTMLFPNASVDRLVAWHQQRLLKFHAVPFSADPLSDLKAFRLDCFSQRHERGELRYIDASEQAALPTWVGGIKQVSKMYLFMLGRRLYPHRWRIG